jgi:hypothetical protein
VAAQAGRGGGVGNLRQVPVSQQSSVSQPVAAPPAPPAPTAAPRRRRSDLLVGAASLLLATWLTSGLWRSPTGRVLSINASDQALFEWLLSYAAHAVTHGRNPLWTTLLNTPDGVNLAVNTASTVWGVVVAPVTLTLGPSVSFALVLTANLALSGFAWYWLFSRRLGVEPVPAAVAGLFCGFAPGVVSHANAHLNFTAQFLLPVIISLVLGLFEPGAALRRGALLGLLVAVQFSLAAELLFFTALACGVLLGGWALAGRREPRARLIALARGLAVTAVVAFALLAYPMWLMFLGPQVYHGTGFDQRIHSEPLLAFGAYPHTSLAGAAGLDTRLAANLTEENSFFGPALLAGAVVAAVLLIRRVPGRRALVWALVGTAGLFAVLSLGPRFKWDRHITDVPLPYALLAKAPLFDAALPARLALVVVPVVGALVALALDAAGRLPDARRRRAAWAVAAVALLPLLPVPLPSTPRAEVPRFVASGAWRDYVRPGGTLVPVPPASDVLPDGQRWQAAALADGGEPFRIPAGFFLGPGGPDGRGRIGPVPRPTQSLLEGVVKQGGVAAAVTDADRRQARADLAYWRAEAVVLADPGPGLRWAHRHEELRITVERLLGPGTRVHDAWVWRV